MTREAEEQDLRGLLRLYLSLHETELPGDVARLDAVWRRIMGDADHHVIVAEEGGQIVSSCVCVVIPNLTRGLRPYALLENVVTDARCRRRGYASACLGHAKQIAAAAGCYKMMLLTGTKEAGTLDFYRRAGFNSGDKTAFVQWL